MRSHGRSEIGGEINAIVRRAVRSTIAIDEGRDRRARSSDDCAARRSTSALAIAINEGHDRPTSEPLDDRRLSLLAHRTIAPLVDRRLSLLPLSLSDLGSLFSLSLSLFPEMI